MLEKPSLQEESVLATLYNAYGVRCVQIEFLPLGADLRTAVYRVVAENRTPYFVKLRSGDFNEITVTLPKFFHDQGTAHIIAPLVTKTGRLLSRLEDFNLMLYPFIEGQNGYEVDLSERQWAELGSAFKRIHTTPIPPPLQQSISHETYTAKWRDRVKTFLVRDDAQTFTDSIAIELFTLLEAKRGQILTLVERAERLAQELQSHTPEFVLCHADIHAGNILIERNGGFYIVDWDDPIFAPKERDLMFFGGGLWGRWHTAPEEERLFYQGYGETEINPVALAYYRYERIVQDIAVDCDHILQTHADHDDRAQSLYYLKSNFLQNSTIELADKSYPPPKK